MLVLTSKSLAVRSVHCHGGLGCKTLDITIQDLPREVTLDLSDAGGETLLENPIDSLKSEVLYNSRFDGVTAQRRINVEVLDHQGSTFTLRLIYTKLVA